MQKVDGSKTVSSLGKKADKLERVAKNSPSARNGVQAAEARNAANNANIRNEAAGTVTSETTESTINTKTKNLSFSLGGNGGSYNPNAPYKIILTLRSQFYYPYVNSNIL